MTEKERLVAHRGFTRLFPENTLSSVRGALKLGLKWVEIDVQMTADQVPVVYHDAKLWRMSRRPGDIRRLPWSRVRRLPSGTDRIASLAGLARLFARSRGARLFVELKEESLNHFGRVEMLARVAHALRPIRARCILISFDEEVLRLARLSTSYPLGLVLRGNRQLKSEFMRAVKPEFIFRGTRLLPRRGSLKLKGVKQCVYEVPDPEMGRELMRRGVDLIETFAPDNYLHRLP